jgi:hypothetical protein
MSPSAFQEKQERLKGKIARSPLDFIPGCIAEKSGWIQKQQF